ncbi:DUF6617 family protein [Flavobacterium beibuense]|uniref:Uncharacterized protein n=1 Tax=Flavobacterium beibuense TaxID=657326 RepID=A0A444W7D1_9FLAO|nr:DUF6617 family protein [Flavobacterium beibuense]RYJ41578.1 hypothetical protein NU09_2952 [Flavobacterium beibuense]
MDKDISPLNFFNDLLFFDGINHLISSFYNNNNLLEEGYIFITEHSCYLKTEMLEDGPNAQFSYDEITKEKFFITIVLDKKKDLLDYFSREEAINLALGFSQLKVLYQKSKTKDTFYFNKISEQLYSLIEDLRLIYPEQKHSLFNVLTKYGGSSYFQYKDLKNTFFEDLYEVGYELGLIDDVEIPEEMFYSVFTCLKPDEALKLTFNKSNPIVAYFLKQIEPFFDNLNAVTIEKSCSFYNKQGKLLKSTDLYAALSRGSDRNKEYFDRIDRKLNLLKLKYLK